jgi:hypothetical protein
MLQGNVVVEVHLLGPFQGELRSVQVPQEGIEVVVVVPRKVLIVLLESQPPLGFLIAF